MEKQVQPKSFLRTQKTNVTTKASFNHGKVQNRIVNKQNDKSNLHFINTENKNTESEMELNFMNVGKCLLPSRPMRQHKSMVLRKKSTNLENKNNNKIVYDRILCQVQQQEPAQLFSTPTTRQVKISSKNVKRQTGKSQTKLFHKKSQQKVQLPKQQAKPYQINFLVKNKIDQVKPLNGIKNKKPKKESKKQFWRELLARTKVEDDIMIGRSQYQSNAPRKQQAIVQKQVAIKQEQIRPAMIRSTDRKRISNILKKSDDKLPEVNQHKQLVAMVKQQEQRRLKRREENEKSERAGKQASNKKQKQKSIIMQEIQQSYETNKVQKQQPIQQMIQIS